MEYNLPKRLEIAGTEYDIRWDFRAILDICAALSDADLDDAERALAALMIFYPDWNEIPPAATEEALRRCFWFINGGQDEPENKPRRQLMSWDQDWPLIVAPVSRVLGRDVRGMELHWWSFLAAYLEIGGDCTFAQVVAIRSKKSKGKTLSKEERAWYRENHELVDFKTQYTDAEQAVLKLWGGAKSEVTEHG